MSYVHNLISKLKNGKFTKFKVFIFDCLGFIFPKTIADFEFSQIEKQYKPIYQTNNSVYLIVDKNNEHFGKEYIVLKSEFDYNALIYYYTLVDIDNYVLSEIFDESMLMLYNETRFTPATDTFDSIMKKLTFKSNNGVYND